MLGKTARLQDLADKLERSRKTIQKNITHLNKIGHIIRPNRTKKIWEYLGAPKSQQLKEEEIFALLIAQKVMAHYQGTPFEAPLANVFQRMSGEKSKTFEIGWEDLRRGISIKTTSLVDLDIQTYQTVVKALCQNQQIIFTYQGNKDKSPRKRSMRPLHLTCVNSKWYLITWDCENQKDKTFALCRMRNVELGGVKYSPTDTSKILKGLKLSMGIFTGCPEITVRLRLDYDATRWLKERVWHHSQQFQEEADGSTTMILQTMDTVELEQWILGWAEHVAVIEPIHLRKKIENRLRLALKNSQQKVATSKKPKSISKPPLVNGDDIQSKIFSTLKADTFVRRKKSLQSIFD